MSSAPKISVLLCTVRPNEAYVNQPEWLVLDKVVQDLNEQTFKDFELVVVDGLVRNLGADKTVGSATPQFPFCCVQPTPSFWTRHKKVAICRYRNTGIVYCRGELIVNIDDCCELPPNFLLHYWTAWSAYNTCLAALWPDSGDNRSAGDTALVTQVAHPSHPDSHEPRLSPGVYGFGSYPREVALKLNGYNEWFDGGQGLEDCDWSIRLAQAGVRFHLHAIPGFRIHAQSAHDPRVIDPDEPIVKCCNPAWWQARVLRRTTVANEPWPDEVVQGLVGPCMLLGSDGMCMHHMGNVRCGYLDSGFAAERHELAWEGVQAERGGFGSLEELK